MSRNPSDFTALPEDTCIDIRTQNEVESWMQRFGVSEVDLRLAVAEVGERAQDVRVHLGV